MMKLVPLALTAFLFSTSAAASVITVGGGYAGACYEAADAQDATTESLDACDLALSEEALVHGDRIATHVNRGILHLRRGNLAGADGDFDRALALDPTEAEAWLNKAILTVRYRDSRNALPFVAKALENGTRRPEVAYFVRAMANEDSGNIAAAYRDLQKARSLAPKWREPVAELARYQVRRH